MDSFKNKVFEATDYVQGKIDTSPLIGLQIGTGLGDIAEGMDEVISIDYRDIPHFAVSTVPTHRGRLLFGLISGKPVIRMAGLVLIASCLFSLVLLILTMAAVPPVSRDALTHHLAVPKLWIAHGGMVDMPDLVFSYYPMNLDLLYVIPMLLGNDILPKYLHFLFALATAWMIYDFLRHRSTLLLGLLGALLFLSIPVIVRRNRTDPTKELTSGPISSTRSAGPPATNSRPNNTSTSSRKMKSTTARIAETENATLATLIPRLRSDRTSPP